MKPTGTAAILLSRQPMRPSGKCRWVRQSVKAVRWLKQNDYALCSSVGQQTWELLTAVASIEDVPLVLFLRNEDSSRFSNQCADVADQFDLNLEQTEFVRIDDTGNEPNTDEWMLRRDMAVVSRADLILPVSIRKEGHMNLISTGRGSDGKKIDTRFETIYEERSNRLAYGIDPDSVDDELRDLSGDYLVHWTRSSNTVWPDEKQIDYYRDIMKSKVYPRSAFDTLQRILTTGRIIASARHMPGRIAAVSFSGLTPMEVVPLMRWRARYRQMSFEPYGIGVKKEIAEKIGICPVRYFKSSVLTSANDQDRWLCQSVGTKGDWRAEKEYRHLGDLDLRSVNREDLIVFCRTKAEAALLQEQVGIRTVAFLKGLVEKGR